MHLRPQRFLVVRAPMSVLEEGTADGYEGRHSLRKRARHVWDCNLDTEPMLEVGIEIEARVRHDDTRDATRTKNAPELLECDESVREGNVFESMLAEDAL